MKAVLERLFNVEAGEGRLVFVLGLLLFGNSMSIQMSSVIAISGFLSIGGVDQFLLVLLFDMLVVLVVTALQSLIIDRFTRVSLLRGVSVAFALAFLSLAVLMALLGPSQIFYSLIYILSEQQILFFPLLVWTLAGDLVTPSQSARLFPTINSLRFVGRIAGLAVLAGLALLPPVGSIGAQEVLLLNALFYLGAYVLVTAGLHGKKLHHKPVQASLRQTLTEGWSFIKEVPMFRYFTLAILLISSTDILIEFRFLGVTEQTLTGVHAYETFFSLYRISVGLLSFAVSSFVVSRILQRFGVRNGLFGLPVVILAGAILMLIYPSLDTAIIAMGLMQLTRDTVYDSSRMSFFALVPNERRGRVNIFIDSYVLAAGTIIGVVVAGAFTLAIGRFGGAPAYDYYLTYVAVASVLAVFVLYRLRKVYDSSLFNWRLKRRKRVSSVFNSLEL